MYVCIQCIIKLTILKTNMKKRLHRYNINRPKSRYGHKYSKYQKCHGMMMLFKQHLSNIWGSVHEKVKQHWSWVEEKRVHESHIQKPERLSLMYIELYMRLSHIFDKISSSFCYFFYFFGEWCDISFFYLLGNTRSFRQFLKMICHVSM